MPQPSKPAEAGVVLTIGGLNGSDRCAIVLPIFSDVAGLTAVNTCENAVIDARLNLLPTLLACMSDDAQVTYIQAESMIDGYIPSREDYALGTYVGLRGGGVTPSNVTMLIAFYEEPADVVPNSRMRVGKTNLWGTQSSDLTGDKISSAAVALLTTLGGLLVLGYVSAFGSGKWYRAVAIAKPRISGTPIKRVAQSHVRNYVCTQRRRMLPRD